MRNAERATGGRRGTRGARGDEEGFALLVSIIAIVGLTALATGGFVLANAERTSSTSYQWAVEALYLADAGLNEYLTAQKGVPSTGTYGPYNYADGWAEVTVTRVGSADQDPDDDDEWIYRVAADGHYDADGDGTADVSRTVETLAQVNSSVIPSPPAGLASGGGVKKNGDAGLISGVDSASTSDCAEGGQATRAGVRVPVDGYSQSGGSEEDVLEGDPLKEEVSDPLDFDGDGTTADETAWWEGVRDGTRLTHDHTVGGSDGGSWPELGSDDWPVTYVDEDTYSVGSNESGQGILIFRGDATFKGGFEWDGLVLVGGTITDNGDGRIMGGTMSGLNTLLGQTVGEDDIGDDTLNGAKTYGFHSCNLDKAQKRNVSLERIYSAWRETF